MLRKFYPRALGALLRDYAPILLALPALGARFRALTPHFPTSTRQLRTLFLDRLLRPALPLLVPLAYAAIAHAQTVDITPVTTFTNTLVTAIHTIGAGFVLIGLFIAAFQFLGRNIIGGIISLIGALFGAGIFAWGPGWVTSLSGATVAP